jgi:hypothetical protein
VKWGIRVDVWNKRPPAAEKLSVNFGVTPA